jgi:hypothetical protein
MPRCKMIGLFTDPQDDTLVRLVKDAISITAPDEPLSVFPLEHRPDSRALESREFAREILKMDACIIDGDQRSMYHYAAELGSLAAGISYWAGQGMGDDREELMDLDHRILLITRKAAEESEIHHFFRDYYTILSLAEGSKTDHVLTLSRWIKETINRATAKVFVSYRSSQKEFSGKVASFLKEQGAAVWYDEMSIHPGESIPTAINLGLGWCTHMVLVIDESFFDSEWTKAEYESVLYRFMNNRGRYRFRGRDNTAVMIPLFLADPNDDLMPPMLRRIRGIDCRSQPFAESMNQLWNAISLVGPRW